MNNIKSAFKNKTFIFGFFMVFSIILFALFADIIMPYTYDKIDMSSILKPPSMKHLFGTDHLGRDIFSRVVYGSRLVLQVSFIAVLIQGAIGITFGLIAGYFGKAVEKIISFITYITLSLPVIALAIAIISVLGTSMNSIIVATSLVMWARLSRVVTIKTMALKSLPFIDAAKASGESSFNILLRYILPNISSVIIVLLSTAVPTALATTTGLSFLGMGAQPPIPEWGAMVSEGLNYIISQPWVSILPGLILAYAILGFNLLGEGLRDLLDPTLKV